MPTDTYSIDEEIIEKIKTGKSEEYSRLVKRYEEKLKRYVYRLINRKEEVDDIVQNVFIKVYVNLPLFDKRLTFSSWIYRIAHNETINTLSSTFLQKFVSITDWFSFGKDDSIEDQIDDEIMKKKLKLCIDQLDIKYKEPLVLFYYEEKTYEEISDILRIPIKTIGVLIHRAKLHIKKLCNEKNNSR